MDPVLRTLKRGPLVLCMKITTINVLVPNNVYVEERTFSGVGIIEYQEKVQASNRALTGILKEQTSPDIGC